MHTLSIKNLVKRAYVLQDMMALNRVKAASSLKSSYQSLVCKLVEKFNDSAESIEWILKKNNVNAANLAIRSRRAFQWIKFLANNNHLQSHLDTLQRVSLFLPSIQQTGNISGDEIEFCLYHTGSLFKYQKRKQSIRITTQESFLNAPDSVLIAILEETLSTPSRSNRGIIKEYALSKALRKEKKIDLDELIEYATSYRWRKEKHLKAQEKEWGSGENYEADDDKNRYELQADWS